VVDRDITLVGLLEELASLEEDNQELYGMLSDAVECLEEASETILQLCAALAAERNENAPEDHT